MFLKFHFSGYIRLLTVFLVIFLMCSCWSPRCPRKNCRVKVEHRHGSHYYRPREALSWMWSRKYQHIRTPDYAAAGPNSLEKVKIWDKLLRKQKRKEQNK